MFCFLFSSSQKVRSPFRSPASPGLERKKFRKGSHTDSERDPTGSFVCENSAVRTFFSDSELDQDVVMKSAESSSPGKKEILKAQRRMMSVVLCIQDLES